MKRLALLLLLLPLAAILSGQSGLFELAFGDDLNTADSLLFNQGLQAEEIEGSLVKYYPLANDLVESVVLIVDPATETVAGWFVLYSKENSQEQDDYVLARLHLMHGDQVSLAGPDHLVWSLSPTLSVQAQYTSGEQFCVLYYDSAQSELFTLPPSARLRLPPEQD